MAIPYNGNPYNVNNPPLTRTISNVANNGSGGIRVTTTTPHSFSSQDNVYIFGVVGSVEANGVWSGINVISSTAFDLPDGVFGGAYVSGGTAEDISLNPNISLPSDGVPLTGALLRAPLQALADRTQYLALNALNLGGVTNFAVTTATSGTVQSPPWASKLVLYASGGGGSGGGGSGALISGSGSAVAMGGGGGGGGGAIANTIIIAVSPATNYLYAVGAGGVASTGGTGATGTTGVISGGDGHSGGDTTFTTSTGALLATFPGASGGQGGSADNTAGGTSQTQGIPGRGGAAVKRSLGPSHIDRTMFGDGGAGGPFGTILSTTTDPSIDGSLGLVCKATSNSYPFTFGRGGAIGFNVYAQGLGGGGGGAASNVFVDTTNRAGDGGAGGTNSGSIVAPTAGAAAIGLGCGGGGGGAGAWGVASVQNGAAGAIGKNGFIYGYWLR